ncbi:unnamed protein product [Closterium sp. NIES-54]
MPSSAAGTPALSGAVVGTVSESTYSGRSHSGDGGESAFQQAAAHPHQLVERNETTPPRYHHRASHSLSHHQHHPHHSHQQQQRRGLVAGPSRVNLAPAPSAVARAAEPSNFNVLEGAAESSGRVFITAYDDKGFTVGGRDLDSSILCVGDLALCWSPSCLADVTPDRDGREGCGSGRYLTVAGVGMSWSLDSSFFPSCVCCSNDIWAHDMSAFLSNFSLLSPLVSLLLACPYHLPPPSPPLCASSPQPFVSLSTPSIPSCSHLVLMHSPKQLRALCPSRPSIFPLPLCLHPPPQPILFVTLAFTLALTCFPPSHTLFLFSASFPAPASTPPFSSPLPPLAASACPPRSLALFQLIRPQPATFPPFSSLVPSSSLLSLLSSPLLSSPLLTASLVFPFHFPCSFPFPTLSPSVCTPPLLSPPPLFFSPLPRSPAHPSRCAELLLLGTGQRMQAVPGELREFVRACGMKLEVLSTRHAIATLNVLNEEGRSVAAALLLPSA